MTERGLQLIIAPSVEWYSTSFVAGVVTKMAISGMQKIAETLTMVNEIGINLQVQVVEEPLTARPARIENCIQFVIEILLVGSATVSNDEGKRTNPELYDLRVPLDVNNPQESGIQTGEQLLDLLILRNFTYVSTRTKLDPSKILPETVFDVFTPRPIGFMEAIQDGIAPDGGLYMPRCMPKLTRAELGYLANFPGKGKYSKNRYHRTALFITERMMGLPSELTVDVEAIRDIIIGKIEELKDKHKDKFEQLKKKAGVVADQGSGMVGATGKMDLSKFGIPEGDHKKQLLMLQQKAASGDLDARKQADAIAAQQEAILKMAAEMFREQLEKIKDKLPENIYNTLLKVVRLFTGALPPRYGIDVPRPPVWSKCVDEAYAPELWEDREDTVAPFAEPFEEISPLVNAGFPGSEIRFLNKKLRVCEMWHGPTAGHKDYGHQIFPALFKLANEGEKEKDYFVVCATNGESGVAALDSLLKNGPKTLRIVVLYPTYGISLVQRAHLLSMHDGWRVHCVQVGANFDAVQKHLKRLLNDKAVNLSGKTLTSANSVNYGRILPMLIYFAQVYADSVMAQGTVDVATSVSADTPYGLDIAMPAGNLGNVTAALMAKEIGIPIRTIIVCCNANDAMVEFYKTGKFSLNAVKQTESTALDIALGGNLERLLYCITKKDTNAVRKYMEDLEAKNAFELKKIHHEALQKSIWATSCTDAKMKEMMKSMFDMFEMKKLVDPSTAVTMFGLKEYMNGPWKKLKSKDQLPIVVCSTTHWAKFPELTLKALKKPLCSYAQLGMDPPEGWEPETGFACCHHPEVPGEPEPPYRILYRHYQTCMSVSPDMDPIPQTLRELATHAPRLPAVEVDGSYESVVQEVEAFAAKSWEPTFDLDEFYQAPCADKM